MEEAAEFIRKLVPLARSRREMADLERKGEAVGQLLKFPPPPPDALRGEFGRIGVDADVDPSGIGRQVLDPVGSDLAGIRIDEVMDADLFGGGVLPGPHSPRLRRALSFSRRRR